MTYTRENLSQLEKGALVELLLEQQRDGIALTFAGKPNAQRIRRLVRPRAVREFKTYGAGDDDERSRNRIIEGENLQAMATLYKERGGVDLILTDPPYNTGNDFRYNDKWDEDPNDPDLGELVAEDDGARHTKWLKFMYPRLLMMRDMLKPGGVLAICIDQRELFRLGQLGDEVFGEGNRLAIINWQKTTSRRSDHTHITASTEYVLVYTKNEEEAQTGLLPRDEKMNSRYGHWDEDPNGPWREANLTARSWSASGDFAIQSPFTGEYHYPSGNGAWRRKKSDIKDWLEEWGVEYEERDLEDGRESKALVVAEDLEEAKVKAKERLTAGNWPFIWFGMDGTGRPRAKTYLNQVKQGKVPLTYWADEDFTAEVLDSVSWDYEESGRTNDGVEELNAIVGSGHGFDTVKPMKLFSKIIQLWCPPNGLVLDPFAGSGTTGHAVLALNEDEGAERRFILIEQGRKEKGDSYARTLLADRLQRVVSGKWKAKDASPLGGGFTFLTLQKKVDAEVLLLMERDELTDTVVASHFDRTTSSQAELIRIHDVEYQYLVARNDRGQGYFLVWDGPNSDLAITEEVHEAIADEARRESLDPPYHVYARFNLYQTDDTRFYQIPNQILMDFGVDLAGDDFHEAE